MLCISRITDEKIAQKFGDGKHNFHIEMRCNLPCMTNCDICEKCVSKSATYKTHGSRKFDQGKVNEPIPDHSHIFGGKWYQMRVKDWGVPPAEIIRFAQQYQAEARKGFFVVDTLIKNKDELKDNTWVNKQDKQHKVEEHDKEVVKVMPRRKKPTIASSIEVSEQSEKTTSDVRDIVIKANENMAIYDKNEEEKTEKSVKKRRPIIASATLTNTESNVVEAPKEKKSHAAITRKKANITEEPKKRSPKKQVAPIVEPITNPLLVNQPIIFQEAVVPTMMEEDIEQVDTDGYEIEYITLREFELNNTTYYIESSKGKLYKKVKGGIGPYIGRYHKDLEEIDVTIPDSDDESS